MAIIKIENLSKIYSSQIEEVQALKNINLTINRGDFIVVNGPSGSGKSTLLNLLAGIDEASSGEIEINKTSLNFLSDRERTELRRDKIGLVFQYFELVPVLTVWENVEYPLLLQKVSKAERKKRVDKILKELALDKMDNRLPGQLSGGQKQRVAIARALVTEPEVVLADEPTGNLDSETGKTIIELMLNLNNEYDVAFVIVTHDLFINRYAQKLIEIKDGTLSVKEVS
ncbi:ABC transporter ATP-binding protein [Halocella sp. SP3-1]|uniref:ABC transporter ATP-binding protein n=1 Tax=Halocella sp. SP3-1 TaxID=2382161 RepID=UPI000F74D182|nr:ABC transporter ATP-binding protein [Halocella sp. SP3-1]AZO93163.1 ABC transporter ATP-binding protein [Halocella sp. SP3-1]